MDSFISCLELPSLNRINSPQLGLLYSSGLYQQSDSCSSAQQSMFDIHTNEKLSR